MTNALLEHSYRHHFTLLQVLTKISPHIESFICKKFDNFLRSNIVATNCELEVALRSSHDIPSLEVQKELMQKFSEQKSMEAAFMNLFNQLVGLNLTSFITKNCSVFFQSETGNCLFFVRGNEFFYKIHSRDDNLETLHSTWTNVNPRTQFGRIIQELLTDQNNKGINKESLQEWKLDQMNKAKYSALHNDNKTFSQINLFYSRHTSGQIDPICILSTSNTHLVVRKVKKDLLSNSQINAPESLKIEKYLAKIHDNYLNCNLDSLLKKHCILPSNASDKAKFELEQALQQYTPHKSLFRFIYSLFYRIFPSEIFGSKHNQRVFYNNLKQLLTASVIAKFRIWDLINGIDLKDMKPLFAEMYSHQKSNGQIECLFLCWIFECMKYIVKSKFYVTESANHKYSPLFYRFDLWTKIRYYATKQFEQEGKWQLNIKLKPKDQCKSFADFLKYSSFRLIPKKNGLRPITSLKFYHKYEKFKRNINIIRLLLRRVRTHSALDNRDRSVHTWNIHEKISKIKNSNPHGPFYVVRGDFENCYQSIQTDQLMLCVKQQLSGLLKCDLTNSILPIELISILKKRGNFYSKKTDLIIKENKSILKSNPNTMLSLAHQQLESYSLNYCVVSSIGEEQLKLATLLNDLEIYLKQSCVRLGKKSSCKLKCGIRQGGPLSSDLCDIYLNCLWRQYCGHLLLNNELNKDYFFINVADDFLFVCVDREKAMQFATIIQNGFQSNLNLKVNSNKFLTNFAIESGLIYENVVINFLGRKLYTADLTVGIDFDSFVKQRIIDTFSCNPFLPVMDIMRSLTATMHFYCFPEMFDTVLTSRNRVLGNLFDRFLLQAFRFAGYLCSSPRWRSSNNLGVDICVLIYQMSERMYKLINKWKQNSELMQCCLTRSQFHYIAASAFHLLWNKGPHKVTCRTNERKTINACFQQLGNGNVCEYFKLPVDLYEPFDQIEL